MDASLGTIQCLEEIVSKLIICIQPTVSQNHLNIDFLELIFHLYIGFIFEFHLFSRFNYSFDSYLYINSCNSSNTYLIELSA